MPTDPGHEFLDVVEQLCGQSGPGHFSSGEPTPYPTTITNEGFVSNYATTKSEIEWPGNPRLPIASEWGDIMKCFDTKTQLPVIYTLATNFSICDNWFSSIPGPTWPNRFFVHGASSSGWADSPGTVQMGNWKKDPWGGSFTYPNGSIFDRLTAAGLEWAVFADGADAICQVTAIENVSSLGVGLVSNLSTYLNDSAGYPYAYTFIEPNYGRTSTGSYLNGSSQHPLDGVHWGEVLIKTVYEAIRNSPVWETSLLIITYDEHGGFYDSVAPPAAPPPNDGSQFDSDANKSGFMFDRYGPRVPAVVVSPLIPAVYCNDHQLYDHASIPATLEVLFGLQPLTDRDKSANHVLGTLTLTTPRQNCPTSLPDPPPDAPAAAESVPTAELEAQPLPDEGNILGFLQILLKADLELANDQAERDATLAKFDAIKTRGDASAYQDEVTAKLAAERERRATESSQPPAPRPR
jgi:phospholipase C